MWIKHDDQAVSPKRDRNGSAMTPFIAQVGASIGSLMPIRMPFCLHECNERAVPGIESYKNKATATGRNPVLGGLRREKRGKQSQENARRHDQLEAAWTSMGLILHQAYPISHGDDFGLDRPQPGPKNKRQKQSHRVWHRFSVASCSRQQKMENQSHRGRLPAKHQDVSMAVSKGHVMGVLVLAAIAEEVFRGAGNPAGMVKPPWMLIVVVIDLGYLERHRRGAGQSVPGAWPGESDGNQHFG
jgi:hypothetical protein